MNRRTFVMSLAASACSSAPPPRRRAQPAPPDAEPGPVIADYAFTLYPRRIRRGWMDVDGDRLANPELDGLAIWDTLAMKRIAIYKQEKQSFCFLRDGTLSLFAVPAGSDHCVFHRIDAAGQLTTVYGPRASSRGALLPSPRDDEYYVLEQDLVRIYTASRGRAEATARVELPRGTGTNPGLVRCLADGRILAGDGPLALLARDGTTVTHETRQSPAHIAMISDRALWYAYAELGADRVARITRLDLTAPTGSAPTIELDTEHVVYLACAPSGALAALVFRADLEAERPQALNWEVIHYSADGIMRWRRTALQSGAREDIELSETLDVAMTEQRVIMRGKQGALTAWDVASGDPVPLA